MKTHRLSEQSINMYGGSGPGLWSTKDHKFHNASHTLPFRRLLEKLGMGGQRIVSESLVSFYKSFDVGDVLGRCLAAADLNHRHTIPSREFVRKLLIDGRTFS